MSVTPKLQRWSLLAFDNSDKNDVNRIHIKLDAYDRIDEQAWHSPSPPWEETDLARAWRHCWEQIQARGVDSFEYFVLALFDALEH